MQLGGVKSPAFRFLRSAPAQSRSSWIHGLAAYVLSEVGTSRWLKQQRARVGSQTCIPQGPAGYARPPLQGARASSCLERQNSISRVRTHGRGLERGPSAGACSGFVLGLRPRFLLVVLVCCTRHSIPNVIMGLLPRLMLRLLVCCTRRSISIDEPWAVGH